MTGENAYRSLFASVPLGILLVERDGRIRELNPVLAALFDLPRPGNGVPVIETIQEYTPFRECGIPDFFARVLSEGRSFVSEGSCSTSAGDRITVRYFLSPMDREGVIAADGERHDLDDIHAVQCIVVDLTGLTGTAREVRRIYARFDSIVSNISPVVTLNGDYEIEFANRTFARDFLELPEAQSADVEGRSIFDVFSLSATDARRLRANVEESSQRVVENCEFKTRGRIVGYTIFRFGEQIGLILKDISRIKRLEEKVVRLHSRLLHLQERERQVVARELHDGVGQTILAAKLNFTSYEKDPERFQDRFKIGLDLIDRASQELRDLYTRLYPSVLNDLGLEAAIRWYSKVFLEALNLDVSLVIKLQAKIPRPVETHLFRIVQELFTNIVKHSGASKVDLEMGDAAGAIRLVVQDNGRGFSPDQVRLNLRGFGLDNIRRRVDDLDGRLRIDAESGQGTRFEIELPTDP